MKALRLAPLVLLAALLAPAQETEINVNERYTVESVEVSGVDQTGLSRGLREKIRALVGQKFSQRRLDELSGLIDKALPGHAISVRISRGRLPEHIRVTIEIRNHEERFDLAAPKALYSSNQGWTGEVDASFQAHSNGVTLGLASDGDSLVERSTGLRARYENRQIDGGKLRLALDFGSYREGWDAATEEAAGGSQALYRARQDIEPTATIALARPLKLTVGFSFNRMESQVTAAHSEDSNAVMTALRYDRLVEDSGLNLHRVEAGYNLRAATTSLGGDFNYTRHTFDFRYTLLHGAHRVSGQITAGLLHGAAPMFERFVLGTSSTLRGWNKYELAPLGGNRVAAGSVEYRHRFLEAFYDAGAVWNAGERAILRHSAGGGVRVGDLALLVAFPLRNGRPEPVFIAGLNL